MSAKLPGAPALADRKPKVESATARGATTAGEPQLPTIQLCVKVRGSALGERSQQAEEITNTDHLLPRVLFIRCKRKLPALHWRCFKLMQSNRSNTQHSRQLLLLVESSEASTRHSSHRTSAHCCLDKDDSF